MSTPSGNLLGTGLPSCVDEISSTLVANTDPTGSRQLRELENAIARLPQEQREVLLLIGLEGIRYDQAALIVGVPIGTVRSRLARARDTLRLLLDRNEEFVARPERVGPAASAA